MPTGTSLKSRILILLLLSVCAALAVAGFLLSFAAKEFHQRQAREEFVHAQQALREELHRRQSGLENIASALAGDGSVISSLNMISNYAEAAGYQAEVFDPEKKRLARELSRFVSAGDELSVIAQEHSGVVAAFADKRDNTLLEGIVTYDSNDAVVMLSDAGVKQGWHAGEFPPGVDMARRQLQEEDRFALFSHGADGLYLVVGVPSVRFSRGDMARTVGRILVAQPLGSAFVADLGRYTSMHFAIVLNAPGVPTGLPWLADPAMLKGAPDLMTADEQRSGGWFETDSLYVQAYAVGGGGDVSAYFVLSSDKDALSTQVAQVMGIVLLAFLVAAALVVPLGLALARRSVTRPVSELLTSVEKIGAGDYDVLPAEGGEVAEVTEFSRVASAIREMASTIRDRESQVRLWIKVMENSQEGILVTDRDQRIVLINNAFTRITGYSEDEAIGRSPRILKSGRHPREFYAALWTSLREHGYWQGEIWDRAKDGRIYPSLSSVTAVKDAGGEITHYISIFADLTEQKAALEHIRYLAQYDPLTRLPNRALLHDRLSVALATAARERNRLAVLCVDLNRFKDVNDSFGLAAGDDLLKSVATRLSSVLRDTDTVARVTADQFVLVITGLKRADDVVQLAESVIAAIGAPMTLGNESLHVGACVGIAMAPEDGDNAEALMRNAEAAMYHAKQLGQSSYQFFAADMNLRAQQRLRMENDLRHALENDEFSLFYQPQIDIRSGRVSGAEALIRWRRGETFVSPAEFIPVAEESGLILPIGEWVLREACRQRVLWREAGLAPFPLAVNISALQFRQRDFASAILGLAREYGILPGEIELEVTESVVMHDPEQVAAMLEQLKAVGFGLSIDDFGTGYSSLAYLKRFALDKLKIDASFVRDIVSDSADLAIVHAVVSLGHSLGLKVVAEGVEGLAELGVLDNMGCDVAQGYYFCRPVAAAAFEAWLASYVPQPKTAARPSGEAGGAFLF